MIAMFLLPLLALFPGTYSAGYSSLPVVILRMDDVAVRSCIDMAIAAIDAVMSKNTPITLSVIAKDFEKPLYENVATYIKTISKSNLVEIASHSYSHTSYPTQELTWQEQDLAKAQSVLSGITGMLPISFIPPLLTFDTDTLDAVYRNKDLRIFSAKCQWSRTIPGEVTNCPSPGAVAAPDVYRDGSYQLPAGAVLGGTGYWDNKSQRGNLTEAVRWIESQILNQNFSVVLLNPSEFSISTECVSVDQEKIELLKSLIDYGAGKWQFMTLQGAVMHFANDTTLFRAEEVGDKVKFAFQARLNIAVVLCFSGCVFLTACCSFCRTSTEQKIQNKDRVAAELKRKKDIDSKLKTQRKQRDVELTASKVSTPPAAEKKKLDSAAYSMI